MSYSINFNGVDLSAYGLTVSSPGANLLGQLISHVQLQDRGYAFRPQREPRRITVSIDVFGSSRTVLDGYLDSIKRILTELVVKQLKFDVLSGRYFNAILERFEGNYISATTFRGRIRFICPDPVAYSTTETSSVFNIDADPKTVAEVVGGSAFLLPVFTLVAGEALNNITLLVENETTIEELSIANLTLANTEILVIDSERWLVTKESVAEMSNVTGKFPRLEPNISNSIKVTAFGALGTLNITYKVGYL